MNRGFIFDLDGTIYLEDRLIDGAAEAIAELKKRGDKVVFLTNKSIFKRTKYVEKLKKMGIQVNIHEVINSNFLTAIYLKNRLKSDEKVFVIGEQPLIEELNEQEIKITSNPLQAKYVVIGWDRNFNYEKINAAFQAWRNGAELIATNPDRTCPVKGGQVPDCGSMIGAMEGATGTTVRTILGKPSKIAAKYLLENVLQLNPDSCYVVGDRLETDIKMGIENGMKTVLVLTGITTLEMVKHSSYKPTYILDSVKNIVNI